MRLAPRIAIAFLAFVISSQTKASDRSDCLQVLQLIRHEEHRLSKRVQGHLHQGILYWLDTLESYFQNGGRKPYIETLLNQPAPENSLNWIQARLITRSRKFPDQRALHLVIQLIDSEPRPMAYSRWLQLMSLGVRALDIGLRVGLPPEPLSVKDVLQMDQGDSLASFPEIASPLGLVWMVPQNRIGFENFNALSPYPIYLYGLIHEPLMADGEIFLPSRFVAHDQNHNFRISSKVRDEFGQRSLAELKAFLMNILRATQFENARQRFMLGIEAPDVREAFEVLYFSLWHERSERPNVPTLKHQLAPAARAELIRQLRLRSRNEDMGRRSEESLKKAALEWQKFLTESE